MLEEAASLQISSDCSHSGRLSTLPQGPQLCSVPSLPHISSEASWATRDLEYAAVLDGLSEPRSRKQKAPVLPGWLEGHRDAQSSIHTLPTRAYSAPATTITSPHRSLNGGSHTAYPNTSSSQMLSEHVGRVSCSGLINCSVLSTTTFPNVCFNHFDGIMYDDPLAAPPLNVLGISNYRLTGSSYSFCGSPLGRAGSIGSSMGTPHSVRTAAASPLATAAHSTRSTRPGSPMTTSRRLFDSAFTTPPLYSHQAAPVMPSISSRTVSLDAAVSAALLAQGLASKYDPFVCASDDAHHTSPTYEGEGACELIPCADMLLVDFTTTAPAKPSTRRNSNLSALEWEEFVEPSVATQTKPSSRRSSREQARAAPKAAPGGSRRNSLLSVHDWEEFGVRADGVKATTASLEAPAAVPSSPPTTSFTLKAFNPASNTTIANAASATDAHPANPTPVCNFDAAGPKAMRSSEPEQLPISCWPGARPAAAGAPRSSALRKLFKMVGVAPQGSKGSKAPVNLQTPSHAHMTHVAVAITTKQ